MDIWCTTVKVYQKPNIIIQPKGNCECSLHIPDIFPEDRNLEVEDVDWGTKILQKATFSTWEYQDNSVLEQLTIYREEEWRGPNLMSWCRVT